MNARWNVLPRRLVRMVRRLARPAGPSRHRVVHLHGPSCPFVPDPRLLGSSGLRPVEPSLWRAERQADAILRLPDARVSTVMESDGGPLVRAGEVRSRGVRGLDADAAFLIPRATIRGRTRPSAVTRIDESIGLLDVRARAATFGHWMIDSLPNVWLLGRLEPDLRPSRYLFPAAGAWQQESLKLAGIDSPDLLTFDGFDQLSAQELLVPIRSYGSRHLPAWTVRALREGVGTGVQEIRPDKDLPDRIYVSRAGASRRGIRNGEELSARLERDGFTVIDPSTLSLLQQRIMFASARTIVAAHGAALTNLAWSVPGTRMVELLPPQRLNALFYHFARQADLDYVGVVGETVMADGGQESPHADFSVDIDLVLRAANDNRRD